MTRKFSTLSIERHVSGLISINEGDGPFDSSSQEAESTGVLPIGTDVGNCRKRVEEGQVEQSPRGMSSLNGNIP